MPPDSAPMRIDWTRRTEPAELPEWMDEPCSRQDLQACLQDLGQVNALTLGFRPTLSFLRTLVARRGPSASRLRILDVGFGGGDMLHRIARWAERCNTPVELTGIDLNPVASLVARERYGGATVRWLSEDALSYRGEADVVISSLLTHHLATGDAVQFLRWMEATAKLGWFVNDLERSALSASLFALLARIMRWHRFVKHDGPVSFARSFSREDWQRMLREAGVPPGAAELSQHFPARLCVSRFR